MKSLVLCVAVLGCSAIALAHDNQGPPRSRPQPQQQRQTQPPRIGEERWSPNGLVLYRWSQGGWVATGWQRQFNFSGTRLIYDMYFNNAPVRRVNETVPGWTQMLDLSGNPPYWRAWPNNNPNAIYLYMANQNQWWLEADYVKHLQSILAQLQAAAANQRQGVQQPRNPRIGPGEKLIAPNVRESIPIDDSRRTPEERRYVTQMIAQVQNGAIRTAQVGACEQNRAGTPYDANGNVNRGYYDTQTGVRPRSC